MQKFNIDDVVQYKGSVFTVLFAALGLVYVKDFKSGREYTLDEKLFVYHRQHYFNKLYDKSRR